MNGRSTIWSSSQNYILSYRLWYTVVSFKVYQFTPKTFNQLGICQPSSKQRSCFQLPKHFEIFPVWNIKVMITLYFCELTCDS